MNLFGHIQVKSLELHNGIQELKINLGLFLTSELTKAGVAQG